jgi:hypothetical protein
LVTDGTTGRKAVVVMSTGTNTLRREKRRFLRAGNHGVPAGQEGNVMGVKRPVVAVVHQDATSSALPWHVSGRIPRLVKNRLPKFPEARGGASTALESSQVRAKLDGTGIHASHDTNGIVPTGRDAGKRPPEVGNSVARRLSREQVSTPTRARSS